MGRWNWNLRRRSLAWALRRKYELFAYKLSRGWARVEWAAPPMAVLLVLVPALIAIRTRYQDLSEIQQGVYIEAWGTVLDVLVVGIVLTVFVIARDRRDSVKRYLEEIDDYKKWDSEEARLRIAGNVRRLTRLGKTNIDFSGLILRKFSFASHDIHSLRGATFSLGLRLDRMSKNTTQLEDVDFSHVDCTGVVFSRSTFESPMLGLVGKNLSFVSTKLVGASFDSARLAWTEYKKNKSDWFDDEVVDHDTGQHTPIQIHYPAFGLADLNGCSFRFSELHHADFRDALNVLAADFTGAQGLETCFFDDDVKGIVLATSKNKSARTPP
jgi:uncharacterized protein YjbI with pentapeptide repeats